MFDLVFTFQQVNQDLRCLNLAAKITISTCLFHDVFTVQTQDVTWLPSGPLPDWGSPSGSSTSHALTPGDMPDLEPSSWQGSWSEICL